MKISYRHAVIKHIVTVIPNHKIANSDLPFDEKTKKKIIKMTGVQTRYILDEKTSLLPLYQQAANEIFKIVDQLQLTPSLSSLRLLNTVFQLQLTFYMVYSVSSSDKDQRFRRPIAASASPPEIASRIRYSLNTLPSFI